MKKIAAIRVNAELKAITNSAHIYPATFANIGHNLVGLNETDGTFKFVEIDSVGSFANRIESELANINLLPDITTTIGDRILSVNDVPHRIYDAILRDSTLDGIPWRQSPIGNAILSSNQKNATMLYTYAPSMMLFGGWDSHGGDAAHGTKLTRSVTCEIWGYDGILSTHCSQRIDPLSITSNADKHAIVDGVLTRVADVPKGKKPSELKHDDVLKGKKPSELGHGDVPSKADKGVFVPIIQLAGAISVTRLNRYQFPDEKGKTSPERNTAAVNVLIEIAKLGISRVLDNLDLRSGCDLYTEHRQFDIIYADGHSETIEVTNSTDNLLAAIAHAEKYGLKFNDKPLELVAGDALTNLVARGGDL